MCSHSGGSEEKNRRIKAEQRGRKRIYKRRVDVSPSGSEKGDERDGRVSVAEGQTESMNKLERTRQRNRGRGMSDDGASERTE